MKTAEQYKLMAKTLMEQGRKLSDDFENSLMGNKKLTDDGMSIKAKLDVVNDSIRIMSHKYFSQIDGISLLVEGDEMLQSVADYLIEIGQNLGESPIERMKHSAKDHSAGKEEPDEAVARAIARELGINPDRLVRIIRG